MADFAPSRTMYWTSIALSALVILFLVADAGVNILAPQLLAKVQAQVGFPPELSSLLGGIMLLCAVLFAIPRTSAIGAILITALPAARSARISALGKSGLRRNWSRSRWRSLRG